MRHLLFICLPIVALPVIACSDTDPGPVAAPELAAGSIVASLDVPGHIANKDITEASGLAASRLRDDLLWTHNDSGAKARIYALGTAGESLGKAKIRHANNKDWEDIAAFVLDETAYLLLADVGDNSAMRNTVTLYVVEEPNLEEDDKPEIDTAWQIDLRYPDGPRDVESVAVDLENEQVLLLTKRTIPAELYAVPLRPESDDVQVARFLGQVQSLPQPTRNDVAMAPKVNDWFWQPTAMDIASDGSAIAVVTYHPAVYLYLRAGDWPNTLQKAPLRYTLGRSLEPESVAFSADNQSIFVTIEKKHAPLLRIDIKRDPE